MAIIATLPMSPRASARIGFFALPVLADVLARSTGGSNVIPVNVLGTKGGSEQDHRDMLSRLSVRSEFDWSDVAHATDEFLGQIVDQGIKEGWIQIDTIPRLMCECGYSEILEEALRGSLSTRFIQKTSGIPTCTKCKSSLKERSGRCLVLALPLLPEMNAWPEYAALEFEQLIKDASETRLLISREKDRDRSVVVSGQKFFLDTDFCWMTFLASSAMNGFPVDVLLTSHKTLKHAFWTMALAKHLGWPIPSQVLVVPYLVVRGFKGPEPLAHELIAQLGPSIARFLLAHVMGSSRKEICMESKLLYLIEHSIRVEESILSRTVIEEVLPLWRSMGKQHIQEILTKLRRGAKDISPMDGRVIRSILAL